MTLQDFARGFIQMTHSVAFHAWWQREAILAVILMTRPEGIGGTLKCPYSPPHRKTGAGARYRIRAAKPRRLRYRRRQSERTHTNLLSTGPLNCGTGSPVPQLEARLLEVCISIPELLI